MERPVDIARRGLRELLPEPPWRLATVIEGWGFTVERDVDGRDGVDEGVLVASFQIGSPDLPKSHTRVRGSGEAGSVLVHLAYFDPRSIALQRDAPDDAWELVYDDIDPGPRRPQAVWTASLGVVARSMAGGYWFPLGFGRLPTTQPAEHPEDLAQVLQLETHLHLVAASEYLRGLLDKVAIPSLDALATGMEKSHRQGGEPALGENVRARALALAVRGRLPDALLMVEVSRAGFLRATVDPTRPDDPDRASFLLDMAARLENFASWLAATCR